MAISLYKHLTSHDIPKDPVILTGFRPSATEGNTQTSLTLGHLVQVQQLSNLSNLLISNKTSHKIFCIIADRQGFLDNPTSLYLEDIKRYTQNYLVDIFAMTHTIPNLLLFRESAVHNQVIKLSHYLQINLAHDILPSNSVNSMSTKFGKSVSHARVVSDFYDQAAHAMGANANIVPAGKNQMFPFELYNKAIVNMEKNGFQYNYTKEIIGVLANGYLLGTDGKKMSTSSGNTVDMSMDMQTIENKICSADSSFFDSVLLHFGDGVVSSDKDKKEKVVEIITTKVACIQKALEYYKDQPEVVRDIVYKGNEEYQNQANLILSDLDSVYGL